MRTRILVMALGIVACGQVAEGQRILDFNMHTPNSNPASCVGDVHIAAQVIGSDAIRPLFFSRLSGEVREPTDQVVDLRNQMMPEFGIVGVGKRSPGPGIRIFLPDDIQFWGSEDGVEWRLISANLRLVYGDCFVDINDSGSNGNPGSLQAAGAGACCIDGACVQTTAGVCGDLLSGSFAAASVACGANLCPLCDGDLDGDGDEDLRDLADSMLCIGGRAEGGCRCADLNFDAVVGLDDVLAAALRLGGPSN